MNPSRKSRMKEYEISDYRQTDLTHTFAHVMKTSVAREVRATILHHIASGQGLDTDAVY